MRKVISQVCVDSDSAKHHFSLIVLWVGGTGPLQCFIHLFPTERPDKNVGLSKCQCT